MSEETNNKPEILESQQKLEPLNVEKPSKKMEKRNTLLETNSIARWTNDNLIKTMDKYAFARSLLLFSFLSLIW